MCDSHPYTARKTVTDLGRWAGPGMGVLLFRAARGPRGWGEELSRFIFALNLENRINRERELVLLLAC